MCTEEEQGKRESIIRLDGIVHASFSPGTLYALNHPFIPLSTVALAINTIIVFLDYLLLQKSKTTKPGDRREKRRIVSGKRRNSRPTRFAGDQERRDRKYAPRPYG